MKTLVYGKEKSGSQESGIGAGGGLPWTRNQGLGAKLDQDDTSLNGGRVQHSRLARRSCDRASVSGDVAAMLVESAGEAVVTIAVADEIKKFCLCGVHGGLKRRAPGIRDRPRRQSGMAVGVVGGVESQ